MRNAILILTIILVGSGCASTPAYKDPNVVYLDEVKVTTTDDGKTHVGIFADKMFQYNVEQNPELNQITLDIENADSTYTILPTIAVTDPVISSITKEQTFNQMGMPVSKFTINLKASLPFDAMPTQYGARVEIASSQSVGAAEAVVAAPPPPTEPIPTEVAVVPAPEVVTPPTTGSRVTGLDVIEFPDKSQFIITTNQPVQFSEEKLDKKFTVNLTNVSISENLREFIDFSSANYSILSIAPSIFNSSVSFEMALRDDVVPIVFRDDLTIYIDVPKTMVAQAVPPTTVAVKEPAIPAPAVSGQVINLNVRNAALTDVIAMISKSSGVNIVAGREATGRVTVNLKNVPWDQALMTILRSHQLTYVKEGNAFRVVSLQTLEAEKKFGPFEDLIIPLDFASAGKMKEGISPFLSQYGKISEDKRTNSIIIRDLTENVNKIRVLVGKSDKIEPSVLFDAHFVEVSPAFTKQLAIQWAGSAINPYDAMVGSLIGQGDLYALLEKAESDDLINIVSSAKITTVANREFTMQSFREFPFASKDGGTEYKRYTVGLKGLTKVTGDNLILLSLNLKREFPSSKGFLRRRQSAGGDFANTELRLANGETTVISWSIPGKSREPKELMVFLTPRLF